MLSTLDNLWAMSCGFMPCILSLLVPKRQESGLGETECDKVFTRDYWSMSYGQIVDRLGSCGPQEIA